MVDNIPIMLSVWRPVLLLYDQYGSTGCHQNSGFRTLDQTLDFVLISVHLQPSSGSRERARRP
ncbi:MAG: hypothetical protein ACKVHE_28770 [Planctomycetales bacterium]